MAEGSTMSSNVASDVAENLPDVHDRIAEAYFGKMGEAFMRETHRRVHWVCAQARGETVLDIGCSQGIVPILLGREGKKVTGVDIDPKGIAEANELLEAESEHVRKRVIFISGDAGSFRGTTRVDTVVMSEILEHLIRPAELLSVAADNLVEGGTLVVTVPFGINEYFDHKHTFYLLEPYRLISECFDVEKVEVLGKWIGLVARKRKAGKRAAGFVFDAETVGSLEAGFLELERMIRKDLKWVRSQFNDANAKLKKANEQIGGLQQQLATSKEESSLVAQLSEQVGVLEKARDQAAPQFLELNVKLAGMQAELNHAVSALETERQRGVSDMSGALRRVEALEIQNVELLRTRHAAELARVEEKARASQLASRIETLVNESGVLAEELAKCRVQLSAAQQQVETGREDIRRLSDEAARRERIVSERDAALGRVANAESQLQALQRTQRAANAAQMQRLNQLQDYSQRSEIVIEELQLNLAEARLKFDSVKRSKAFQMGAILLGMFKSPSGLIKAPVRFSRLFLAIVKGFGAGKGAPFPLVYSPEPPSVIELAKVQVEQERKSFPQSLATAAPSTGTALVQQAKSLVKILPATGNKKAWPARAITILDEISEHCWGNEFKCYPLSREGYANQIEASSADFALLESCWKGNRGRWEYAFTSPGLQHANAKALLDAIEKFRARGMKIGFWNKEDPMHYDRFLPVAKHADVIFTTDVNRVADYRRDVPMARIEPLSFAAQPQLCNPSGRFKTHPESVCFAGSYYGVGHDERKRQMDALLPSIREFNGAIYDRMSNVDSDRYRYPDEYQPFIRPAVPFSKMVDLYKSFKVFLNVNTIIDSPTMMSRRVYELLACGTPVVSAPSAAIAAQFDGIVQVAETAGEANVAIDRLLSDARHWDRVSHLGYREVMSKHTYTERLSILLPAMGVDYRQEAPLVSVVMCTRRPHMIERIIRNLSRQIHSRIEVIFVLQGFSADQAGQLVSCLSVGKGNIGRVEVIHDDSERTLGERFNAGVERARGEYIAKMDDDDLYFEHYLSDMLLPFRFGNYAMVGKKEVFVWLEGASKLVRRFPEVRHMNADFVAGPTFVVRSDVIRAHPFKPLNRSEDSNFIRSLLEGGHAIYSTDPYNFVQWRSNSHDHTWRVDDEFFTRSSGVVEAEMLDESIVRV